MNAKVLAIRGGGVLAALAVSSLALAQPAARATAPVAPPAATIAQGPPIAGICVFSPNAIFGSSKVGQAVAARMRELGAQIDAELKPEADAINTESRTIETQRATMDQATYQARGANLELRASNFEKKRELRGREMQATQEKQLGVVSQSLNPVILQLYQEHHCSLLIDGDQGGVKLANPIMDLSSQAVVALNAKIQTLTFDREHLDTQPGAAGPR
jgi:Skp family chaperone for outer membrane proteins